MRVALLGCGAMGRTISEFILRGETPGVELVAASDQVENQAFLSAIKGSDCRFYREPLSMLQRNPDLIIEAASQAAVQAYVQEFLQAGISAIVMSTGALLDAELLQRLMTTADSGGCRLYTPSGAVGGLDVIRASTLVEIERAELVTRKHPANLSATSVGLQKKIAEALQSEKETVIYEGDALTAVKEFPKNVNVAATLYLSGLQDKLRIQVVADPNTDTNSHEVFLVGEFGEMRLKLANKPMKQNPKTSFMSCLSIIALLKRLSATLQVGA